MKGTISNLLKRINLGIRAKLSIVTAFFVITIIIIVSIISLGRQYRSLTESQERELRPIRTFVEGLVLDMENISNTLTLIEEFRARVREKAQELSRYRQQDTQVVTKWSEFAENFHEFMEKTNRKRIEKGEISEEQASKMKSDMDTFAHKMAERSDLFRKLVMKGQETRVVYRDTYYSQYLTEAKIKEIESSIRARLVDHQGRPMPDAAFQELQRHAANAVGAERQVRDATGKLQALEKKDPSGAAGNAAAADAMRNAIIGLVSRREAAMAALNGGLQSFLVETQKKRLLELGLDTASIRMQLFTTGERKPGFDTGIFSDGAGINAPSFLEDRELNSALLARMKRQTRTAGEDGGAARIRRGEKAYEVLLRPFIRNRDITERAQAIESALRDDPGAWSALVAEDAKLAGELKSLAGKLAARLAVLRQTGMRPADDGAFRALYAEYAKLVTKREEGARRRLASFRQSAYGRLRGLVSPGDAPDLRMTGEAILDVRNAALYDFGFLRAQIVTGSYEEYFRSPAAREATGARWRALREWIMRGESETDIPAVAAGGKSLPVFEGGVMCRSRSELEEEMWRLDAAPLAGAGGGRGLARELAGAGVAGLTRTVVDITEGRDRIVAGMLSVIYASLALGAIAVALSLFLSTVIVRDIETISAKAARVGSGDLDVTFEANSRDEIGALAGTLNAMVRGLVERERAKSALGRFVNTHVAEMVLREELKLGGARKECAVLFADIRGFTSMSELMEPEQVVEFLNEYMTAMVACVDRTGGIVDKFIGDAVMATWGAAFSTGNDPESAVSAALMMRAAITEFNRTRSADRYPPVRIGIGLNFGPVVAGQIGSEERLEYTVIGDTVNLASRIESLTKEIGCDILISQGLYERVRESFRVARIQDIKVKGKIDLQTVYAVLGRADDPGTAQSLDDLRVQIG
jgi:adenylate cyclase